MNFHKIRQERCAATRTIREWFGVKSALVLRPHERVACITKLCACGFPVELPIDEHASAVRPTIPRAAIAAECWQIGLSRSCERVGLCLTRERLAYTLSRFGLERVEAVGIEFAANLIGPADCVALSPFSTPEIQIETPILGSVS